jgi:hypothetical protein
VVTVDDVQRVARNYLHPDQLTIVLVGDANAFVRQLPGSGFDKFEVIRSSDLDFSSADLRRKPAAAGGLLQPASYTASSTTEPTMPKRQIASADGRAKILLDQAVKAKGGLAKLQGIKTVKVEGTLTYASAGKPIPFAFANYIEYPDRFRVDAETPAGRVTQVSANGKYWIADAAGTSQELDAAKSAPIRAAIERDIVRLLIGAAKGTLSVSTVDTPSEDPLVGALEISGGGMTPVTLLINRDNGLIEMARYDAGAEGRATETYSDYRNVNGIQVPFHTVVRRGALTPIERDVKTIRFNVALDAALFARPS